MDWGCSSQEGCSRRDLAEPGAADSTVAGSAISSCLFGVSMSSPLAASLCQCSASLPSILQLSAGPQCVPPELSRSTCSTQQNPRDTRPCELECQQCQLTVAWFWASCPSSAAHQHVWACASTSAAASARRAPTARDCTCKRRVLVNASASAARPYQSISKQTLRGGLGRLGIFLRAALDTGHDNIARWTAPLRRMSSEPRCVLTRRGWPMQRSLLHVLHPERPALWPSRQ